MAIRLTESRLRQIIRGTLAEMGPRGGIVTVDDVNAVLSALIIGPDWDPVGVQELEKEALGLAPLAGERVLSGIKGWIEGEEEMGNTSNGQADALALIDKIGRRQGRTIWGSDVDEAGLIQSLINAAYTA